MKSLLEKVLQKFNSIVIIDFNIEVSLVSPKSDTLDCGGKKIRCQECIWRAARRSLRKLLFGEIEIFWHDLSQRVVKKNVKK